MSTDAGSDVTKSDRKLSIRFKLGETVVAYENIGNLKVFINNRLCSIRQGGLSSRNRRKQKRATDNDLAANAGDSDSRQKFSDQSSENGTIFEKNSCNVAKDTRIQMDRKRVPARSRMLTRHNHDQGRTIGVGRQTFRRDFSAPGQSKPFFSKKQEPKETCLNRPHDEMRVQEDQLSPYFQKDQVIPRGVVFCFMCKLYKQKIHFCDTMQKYYNLDYQNLLMIHGNKPEQVEGLKENMTRTTVVYSTIREMRHDLFSMGKRAWEEKEKKEQEELKDETRKSEKKLLEKERKEQEELKDQQLEQQPRITESDSPRTPIMKQTGTERKHLQREKNLQHLKHLIHKTINEKKEQAAQKTTRMKKKVFIQKKIDELSLKFKTAGALGSKALMEGKLSLFEELQKQEELTLKSWTDLISGLQSVESALLQDENDLADTTMKLDKLLALEHQLKDCVDNF